MTKKKEELKDAFNKANRKDEQLLADMKQLNETRKKTKELLAQEEKTLIKLERIPEESEKVAGFGPVFMLFFNTIFYLDN